MKKLSTIALLAATVLMSACGPKDPGLKDAYKGYFKIAKGGAANLRVVFSEETGISNVTVATAVAPAKLVKNGQIVIVKNGQMFNAAGAQVK